jgi:hypothetical protein
LQNRRAKHLIEFSKALLEQRPFNKCGIGSYVYDALRIFCCEDYRALHSLDKVLLFYRSIML